MVRWGILPSGRPGVDQTSRPDYSNINDIESIGSAGYNSPLATLRVSNLHRFSSQMASTWSKSLGDVSAFRGALRQNTTNFM
jgi:hypothetical protein